MENITSILKANKELQSKPLPKGVEVGFGKLSIDAENAKIAPELIKRSHEMGFNLGETKYTICQRWTALLIDDAKEVRAFINANMNEDGTFVSVTEAKKRIQEAAEKEEDKIKETPLVTIRQETKDGNPYKFILYIRPDQKGSEIMDSFFAFSASFFAPSNILAASFSAPLILDSAVFFLIVIPIGINTAPETRRVITIAISINNAPLSIKFSMYN